jgi:hypothetical protein
MTLFKIIVLFFLSWGFSNAQDSREWIFSSETQPLFFMKTTFPSGNILWIQHSAEKGLKIVSLDSKKKLLILSDAFLREVIFWDHKKNKHVLLKNVALSIQSALKEDSKFSSKIVLKRNFEKPSYRIDLKKIQIFFEQKPFSHQKNTDIYDFRGTEGTIQIQMGPLYPLKISLIGKKNTMLIENIAVDRDFGEVPWRDISMPEPETLEKNSLNAPTLIKLLSTVSFALSGEFPAKKFLDNLPYNLMQSLQANPKDEKTRVKVIQHFWKKKDYDQASQIAEEGLNINTRSYDLWFWKGIISVCQVKFAIAIPAFEESLKIKPGDFPATFSLAKVYVMLENAESLQKAHALLSAISLSNLSPKERKKCETELRRITELKKTL